MTAMTVLVYVEVRRISFDSTASRLDGVSHLLADALASSAHQRFAALREAADRPRVRAAALRGSAEDNAADVELTLRALRKNNLTNRVHVARDGEEALAFLFGNGAEPPATLPRVVLLDLKLPKVDGIEVLTRIKADPRTRRLPVVVLTSSREEPDIARCYDLGVNSYIVKPVGFEAFVPAVTQAGLYWLLLNQPPA